jgi:spore germination cell wall hydrolase CwlJ-like protein
MTGRGAWRTVLVIGCLAASLRVAAAADINRMPAAPQLAKGELSLLARVVQAEASNQPDPGKRAVAWTAINRLRAGIYGKTLTHVLQARRQYARPRPLRVDSPAYQAALRAALMAVKGEGGDPSRSATHFIRCDMRRRPAWTARFTFTIKIASHCFYRKAPYHA